MPENTLLAFRRRLTWGRLHRNRHQENQGWHHVLFHDENYWQERNEITFEELWAEASKKFPVPLWKVWPMSRVLIDIEFKEDGCVRSRRHHPKYRATMNSSSVLLKIKSWFRSKKSIRRLRPRSCSAETNRKNQSGPGSRNSFPAGV